MSGAQLGDLLRAISPTCFTSFIQLRQTYQIILTYETKIRIARGKITKVIFILGLTPYPSTTASISNGHPAQRQQGPKRGTL